jgi:hypothetical protein
MEQVIVDYIKNMFSTPRPEWSSAYEGVILYDTDNHIWIAGDAFGWIELEEEIE